MATANVTTTTADKFIADLWTPFLQSAYQNDIKFRPLVTTIMATGVSKGDVVHVPNLANIAADDKGADTAVVYTANTETETTISIDSHKYAAVRIEDIVKVQSNYDLINGYAGKLGYACANAVDAAIGALGIAVDAGQTIDMADGSSAWEKLVELKTSMDAANVPSARSLVVHPSAMAMFLAEDKFISADFSDQKALESGYLGSMLGFNIYQSNNVQVDAEEDDFCNMAFSSDAIGLALSQDVRIQAANDIDHLATSVVADTVFGVATINSAGLWMLKSDVPA